ncbi:hypothetical protein Bbelb_303740 [Branchiostoma belcheri]|nr:hypothetical protein Bbelb_303740 [Branchiostoma belcheri]
MCDHPNRLCCKAFNDRTIYNGAVRGCSLDGGTLAMPRDNATNNFLIDLKNAVDKNACFRFGLTDDQQEGVWMWDDNVPLGDFRAWGPRQPDNWPGVEEEDCAEYLSQSSPFANSWNDGNCARTNRRFICQVSPSATHVEMRSAQSSWTGTLALSFSSSLTEHEVQFSDMRRGIHLHQGEAEREFRRTCYKAFGIRKKFRAAYEHCRRDADGGTLAMPKDAATNRFLSSLIRRFKNKYFYIGLRDLNKEGRFEWIDGTKLGMFKFWNPGEPNNYRNREDCVHYHWEGSWSDYDCNKERYFLCQVAPGRT